MRGCANTIGKQLKKIDDVEDVGVDIENGRITIASGNENREELIAALLASGYPEKGSAVDLLTDYQGLQIELSQ